MTVTKQIPAGTVAALGTNPVNPVVEEYRVVVAAPAGPENSAAAATAKPAVAVAPTAAPTTRSLTPGTSTLAPRTAEH